MKPLKLIRLYRPPIILSLLLGLAFSLPEATKAAAITFNPNNYEEGTDLTNVSEYLTLTSFDNSPVRAKRSEFTGDLVFENLSEFVWSFDNCGQINCIEDIGTAFGIHFNQPVSQLSLSMRKYWHRDYSTMIWAAYGTDGTLIQIGLFDIEDVVVGGPAILNIELPNMYSFAIGGNDYGPPGAHIETFSFEVVPEPSSLALLLLGLVTFLLGCKARHFPVRILGVNSE